MLALSPGLWTVPHATPRARSRSPHARDAASASSLHLRVGLARDPLRPTPGWPGPGVGLARAGRPGVDSEACTPTAGPRPPHRIAVPVLAGTPRAAGRCSSALSHPPFPGWLVRPPCPPAAGEPPLPRTPACGGRARRAALERGCGLESPWMGPCLLSSMRSGALSPARVLARRLRVWPGFLRPAAAFTLAPAALQRDGANAISPWHLRYLTAARLVPLRYLKHHPGGVSDVGRKLEDRAVRTQPAREHRSRHVTVAAIVLIITTRIRSRTPGRRAARRSAARRIQDWGKEQRFNASESDASDVDVPGSNPTSVRPGKRHPRLPTTLRSPQLNLRYQEFGKVRNMDKRQHQHCFLSAHFVDLSWIPCTAPGHRRGTAQANPAWKYRYVPWRSRHHGMPSMLRTGGPGGRYPTRRPGRSFQVLTEVTTRLR